MAFWSTARRLYPNDSIQEVAENSKEFRSICPKIYAFYEMSCSVCHQHGANELNGREISSHDLRADCRFCNILRQCCEHFKGGDALMLISCGRYMQDVQICFRETREDIPDESSITRRTQCQDLHVQLFSKEPCYDHGPFSASNDLSLGPSSDTTLNIMKSWINECLKSHDCCRPPLQTFVPRRLIELFKDEKQGARLHSPATPVQFAALSYRWGSDKQSRTLKDNLSIRLEILDTTSWPKTLRDSLTIARGLGLQYIWIDAVCIVQDDSNEWAEEASHMAQIYSNAHVVLSATSANDSAEGFLHKRSEPFFFESEQRDGTILKYYARRNNSHSCELMIEKSDYPLFNRGWCMQERLLARRLIHFFPDEIRYECQVSRECECGAASRECGYAATCQGSHNFPDLRSAESIESIDFAWLWLSIIWDYSKMKLSHPTDILPALSGVAACLEHLKPGKYIAGLWEHRIDIQLGWRHALAGDSEHKQMLPEPTLLGPTFSWSSYTKSIESGAPYDKNSRALCTLDHSDVLLATVNPYGLVRDASIRLSGRSIPGDEMVEHFKTTKPKSSQRLVQLDSGFYCCAGDLPDESSLTNLYRSLEDAVDWESVICFGLSEYDFEDEHRLDALLLRLKDIGKPEYVRIGVAQNLEPLWFHEHATECAVTIV